MTRILWALLFLGCSAMVAADEVRPAYLQLTDVHSAEEEPLYEVLWKQPVVENRRLPIEPVFEPNCELQPLGPPSITANALVQRWQAPCDLGKAVVSIKGLSTSLTDVMLRVVDVQGDFNNFILRPADPSIDLSTDTVQSVSYL
ncbi:MAG TPA: hypothetical protein DDW59_13050, partial [Gammaproteobacteria bacterium]|nr:hypothetical protein [Gammaproteobacteria bacterium]